MSTVSSITDVSVELPNAATVMAVLTFRQGFNSSMVVLGATFLGLAAGSIGAFALLRRRALMGDALAHSALPGLALAYLLGVVWWGAERSLTLLLTGALLSGLLGVFFVQAISRHTRLPEDAAIGAVLSVFFGAGIVLLSVIQNMGTGTAGGLAYFIYGQTAAMSSDDALVTLAAALLAVVTAIFFFKEFRVICFDPEFAEAQGWPVNRLDLLLMGLVAFVTVVGLQSVGILLIVAMLIIPPAAARFWSERLRTIVILSGAFGAISGYAGSAASSVLPRLPAGAVIVLIAGVVFFISFFLAPSRGLVAAMIRKRRLQLRIVEDHLLRELFELREQGAPNDVSLALKRLGIGRMLLGYLLLRMRQKGFVASGAEGRLVLTDVGFAQAARMTRNHRLWEEYLLTHGNVQTSHVDYSAVF
ncbi:MAG: metal ABC transporter permease, partial [Bdellovibrionales bacterium]|nr:metal ABC transporter permease [Bdellovibrionales bacterium]